ncbi:MAG: Na/Pi cotransporter family protein [Anaeroplasmataceae bacterium]|nr:Na/Pi cotransporter family protein [Anaeroplasmataceae bacterium]
MFLSTGLSASQIILELIAVLGGLGLFLYGINQMGDSLKAIAGDKLKTIIEKTTNTPIKGILVGTLVTAVIQSSSGTTALTVGLVRAGLMSFPQAIGVILGANIGATITSFFIGMNIESYSLIFVGIGALMIFFIKNEKGSEVGKVIFGFGMLFFGLKTMGDALDTILMAYEEQATQLFKFISDQPLLGLLIGTAFTALVQSSSAIIGILQTLYQQGFIVVFGAIPIMLGCNIGTTITACIAGVGGGVQAKRTAFVHVMFNVVGAILFLALLWPFSKLMEIIEGSMLSGLGPHPKMTIAIAHLLFNFVTTFIMFFLIKVMVKFTEKLFKDKPDEHQTILNSLLDYSLIEKSPGFSLTFAKKSIDYMCKCVTEYVSMARDYSFDKKMDYGDKPNEIEETIDELDKRIHDYLIKLTLTDLSKSNSHLLSAYLDAIKDLERIGDHCTNLFEFFNDRYSTNKELSQDGIQDLEQLYDTLIQMLNTTFDAFYSWDAKKALEVNALEEQVDKLEAFFHQRHVHRIDSGACSYLNADHYVEILSNLERMGDHLENISECILTTAHLPVMEEAKAIES